MLLIVDLFAGKPLPAIYSAPSAQTVLSFKSVFQKGISYATYADMTPDAYNRPESDESLRRMRQIGVEWVAINVVGWYQTNAYSADIHKNLDQAPTDEALVHVIQSAHDHELKIMLKPMIDLEDGRWRGEIQPSHNWFANYTFYINFFAELAEQNNVEIFCVGTELLGTVTWESEWRNVVSSIRQRYSGLITYAAVWWKEYNDLVKWWDVLDYVGIDAYFPLSNMNDPTINEMKATWGKITSFLESFYREVRKPIVFTEIGYLSTDGTNKDPSNYKSQEAEGRLIDVQEQADWYEAAFQALWNKTWLYGFYWWYWQPDPDAGGSNNSDYTPQNKPAQSILTHWYSLDWGSSLDYTVDYAPYVIDGIILVAVLKAAIIGFLWRRRSLFRKANMFGFLILDKLDLFKE